MKTLGTRSVSSALVAVLSVGTAAVGIVAVLIGCLVLLSLFSDLSGGQMDVPVSFRVAPGTLHVAAPDLDIGPVSLDDVRATALLTFPPPTRLVLFETAAGLLCGLALVLWVLAQLRAVFLTLRNGTPFLPVNARRLRRVAYALIFGELGWALLSFAGSAYVRRYFTGEAVRFDTWPHVNLFALLNGVVVLVIAEVFRIGARLDEDQSLTV